MARAENDTQFKSIAKVFEEITERKTALQQAIGALELRAEVTRDVKLEAQNALVLADRLVELAKRPDLTSAIAVIELTNLKLYFGFTAIQVGKRRLNKISNGVVTFGAAAPPINVYDGRTDRGSVKANGSASHGDAEQQLTHTSTQENQFGSDAEGESLGNVSRDD